MKSHYPFIRWLKCSETEKVPTEVLGELGLVASVSFNSERLKRPFNDLPAAKRVAGFAKHDYTAVCETTKP